MAKNQDVTIESSLPIVQQNGLQTNKAAYFDSTVEINGVLTLDSTPVFASGTGSFVGPVVTKNASAITATGAQALGFSTTSTLGIYYGSGAPTIAAATGSLFLRTDGTGPTNRAFISSGGTGWTGLTTVA